MLDTYEGIKTPDNEVIFYDGILYIISREREPYIDNEWHDAEYSIEVKFMNAEHDEPLTLADIAEKYPNVCKVIFDDALRGYVYSHGNHGKGNIFEAWELVGTTKGYT